MKLEADNCRQQHGNRLPQHAGLGLNSTHAPADHAQSVDHRSMRIGPDQRVRISGHHTIVGLRAEDNIGQIFQIDLVHNAGIRRQPRRKF